MGISKIGVTSNLPAGTIRKVGSGFTANGYGSLTGNFAAGKYLIRSSAPCSVSFGTNYDTRDYSAANAYPGDTVVSTGRATNVFEYISAVSPAGYADSVPGATNPYAGISPGQTYIDGAGLSYPLSFNLWSQTGVSANTMASYRQYLISFSGGGAAAATIYYSTDGYNFTSGGNTSAGLFQTAGGTSDSRYWATDGNILLHANGASIARSTNPISGASWTQTTSVPSNSYLVYGNGLFLYYGTTAGARSSDGITWTATTFPASFNNVAYQNGIFIGIVVGGRTMYYSYDGVTWTNFVGPYSSNNAANDGSFASIAAGNGLFIGMPYSALNETVNGYRYTPWWSSDGINWNKCQISIPFITGAASSTSGNITYAGNYFVAQVSGSTSSNNWITFDGTKWLHAGTAATTSFNASPTYVTHKTRGRIVASSGTASWWNAHTRQSNSSFDVFLLAPNNTTTFA